MVWNITVSTRMGQLCSTRRPERRIGRVYVRWSLARDRMFCVLPELDDGPSLFERTRPMSSGPAARDQLPADGGRTGVGRPSHWRT